MTDEQTQIIQTMQTPGWTLIVNKAKARIEAAKVDALSNEDEARFVELYRKAHAAAGALWDFLQVLEVEAEGEANEYTSIEY